MYKVEKSIRVYIITHYTSSKMCEVVPVDPDFAKDEIVQIALNDFVSCRSTLVKDHKIHEKILQIVDSFGCFKETIPVPTSSTGTRSSFNSNYHHNNFVPRHFGGRNGANSQNHHKHYHNNNAPRPHRLHLVGSGDKDSLALLNKLSPANKEIIFQKLLKLCFHRNDIQSIVYDLINKGSLFSNYIELIMRALDEVNNRYASHVTNAINCYVNEFLEQFECDIAEFQEEPSIDDYNLYCSFVKKKEMLMNRFKMVVTLMDKFQSMDDAILRLIDKMHVFIRETRLTALLVHVVVDLCSILTKQLQNEKTHSRVSKVLHDLVEKFDTEIMMKKTHFKIQDILSKTYQ